MYFIASHAQRYFEHSSILPLVTKKKKYTPLFYNLHEYYQPLIRHGIQFAVNSQHLT